MQDSRSEATHLNSNWHGLKANDRCHPITGKYLSMCGHFLPVVEFATGNGSLGAWLRAGTVVAFLALLVGAPLWFVIK